ncbi:B-cell lymphoma 3 protein [Spea bombifrons]|uniref:B-cell lymphoma 3 protein n=1 Tax=Spea bombifrons TaxID=233779 RepID=UPI00234B8F96|nr:B-cell lymphoma 3 protein [Spea bombifrons]
MDTSHRPCMGGMETSSPLDLSIRKTTDMFGMAPKSPHTTWSCGDMKLLHCLKTTRHEKTTPSEDGSVEEPDERKKQACLPIRKRRYPPSPEDDRPPMEHMDHYPNWMRKCYPSPYMQVPLSSHYQGGAPAYWTSPSPFPTPAPALVNAPLLGFLPPQHPMLLPADMQIQADIIAATQPDEDGDTALHIAVVHGNVPAVQRLLSLFLHVGKDLDCLNNLRQTPLHLAVITDQPALVSLLLAHGCSPDIPDRNGQTCILLACENRSINSLQLLLKGRTWNPEATNYQGVTALHIAISTGRRDIALCLLENGADVDAVEMKSGRTPLIQAVESGCEELVALLLQRGAQVNAQTYAGNTALHVASGRGLEEITRILLRSGADSGIKNCHNDTSITVAKDKRITNILRGKASSPQAQYEMFCEEISDSSADP